MRITLITDELNIEDGGGSDYSLDLIARSLQDKNYDVKVITIRPNMNNLPSSHPYRVIEPSDGYNKTRLGELRVCYKLLHEYRSETDLYHVFSPKYYPAAGYFRSKYESPPVVCRLNNYSFCTNADMMDGSCHERCTSIKKFAHEKNSLPKKIAKFPFYASQTRIHPRLGKHVDQFIAISPAVRSIYTEIGLPKESITVVPNFYDPSFFSNNLSQADETDRFQILYVGRLIYSKGVDILLRSSERLENISVQIVGDGPELESLQSLSRDLGISNIVNFKGWVDHQKLPKYYSEADLFVHPSRWPEPFGRTLLESFQYETPAAVSDIGGPPWVVGEAGQSFETENEDALSSAITDIRNKDDLQRLSNNCSSRLERFRPETIISELRTVYKQLV